ncbi:hypothetical protein GCM10027172_17250 [Halomonas garicola]
MDDVTAILGSLLAAEVALALYDVFEDTEIHTPMSSRIAHLVLDNVLAVGWPRPTAPKLPNSSRK